MNTENLTFGEAIKALQNKQFVARKGWNGKGMFIIQAGGYSVPAEKLRPNSPISAEFLARRGCAEMVITHHFDMWTAQNTYQTGWLASQGDMQATDWEIVNP